MKLGKARHNSAPGKARYSLVLGKARHNSAPGKARYSLVLGKAFGDQITGESKPLNRGDVSSSFAWLERLHPLMRRPPKRGVVRGEKARVFPFYLVLLLVFFVLGVRLTFLALFCGEEYLLAAEGNRIVAELIRPERGVITDRNGKPIATNEPGFRAVADPRVCLKDCDLSFLAKTLKLTKSKVEETLTQGKESGLASVTLKVGISRDAAVKLEANAQRLPGVLAEALPVRSYPYPHAFAHVLGYVGEISGSELGQQTFQGYKMGDWVGKDGLEWTYEKYLQGEDGKRVLEKDAVGRTVKSLGEKPSQPGSTVVTTLDRDLQRYVYGVLGKGTKAVGSKGAVAIVSDVKTGAILSLVSYPSFNPNNVADYISDTRWPLFNRAIGGTYPPGSTFKIVTGSAGLEEGVINASTVIVDRGSLTIPNEMGGSPYIFYGWTHTGLGPLTFVNALSWSSDIYFYTVAGGYRSQPGVGPTKLAEWARKYGMGNLSGIDLPGEAAGIIPDPEWKRKTRNEGWYVGDTYHMGIGQGDVAITPLQLHEATIAVGNGGKLLKPYLVARIEDGDGRVIFSQGKQVRREDFVSKKTLSLLKQGMRKSVVAGPTPTARTPVVEIVGKTGTAQDPPNWPHSWFTAFAPYNNPTIAVTVMVEGGGEGTSTAAPIVRKIMEYYFKKH